MNLQQMNENFERILKRHKIPVDDTLLGELRQVVHMAVRDVELDLEEAHLARIEAQNPGIDTERVKRFRREVERR